MTVDPTAAEAERNARLRQAAEAAWAWTRRQDYRGWDPHDAMRSPLLRAIGRTHRWVGVALLQGVKRSPLNLRPLLGVRRGINAKGMGLLLIAATERWLRLGDAASAREAAFLAEWLANNAQAGYAGPCWGYPFDWPNRGFFAPAGTPTIVNTGVIGVALQDAADSGVLAAIGCDVDAHGLARGACEFVLRDLARVSPASDEVGFAYTPLDRRVIHNATTWGAWLLAAAGQHGGERELVETAQAAARFTARRQQADGSWLYGIGPRDGWVDNFHTGFVLDALHAVGARLGSEEFEPAVARGYAFWTERLFDPDGAPRYYLDRRWPVDTHAVAQGALTHLRVGGAEGHGRARTLLGWGVEHLLGADGAFHYQLRRTHRVRTPFLRWSQAWMLHALEACLLRDEGTSTLRAGTIL